MIDPFVLLRVATSNLCPPSPHRNLLSLIGCLLNDKLNGYLIIVQIDRMEAKVVKPLLEYEGVCKKAKVSL